ncbi:hypothetical protein ACFFJY_10025 [Fictibacillus aquaticus]|uniref:hypothetical protein n=1 Tax=Fictibacillus aquaticus TaxID=2021314 RepID=UPI001054217B|nr:hypothetical protein [Fictibacillus aquaticus]
MIVFIAGLSFFSYSSEDPAMVGIRNQPSSNIMKEEDYVNVINIVQKSLSSYKKELGIPKCPADEIHNMYINGEEASLNYYKGCSKEGKFILMIGEEFGHKDAGREVYSFKNKEIETIIQKY